MLKGFDMIQYLEYIESLSILSLAQKKWLKHIIPFRREKILDWIGRGGDI